MCAAGEAVRQVVGALCAAWGEVLPMQNLCVLAIGIRVCYDEYGWRCCEAIS